MASPVYLDVMYPERLSRWKVLIKWLLAIPHGIVLGLYGMAVGLTTFIAWWAILFTGKYPASLFDFAANYLRWYANVTVYASMRDEYPPFNPVYAPVAFQMEYPRRLSRLLIFVKWLLAVPSTVLFLVFGVGWWVVSFVAFWAVLITGRYPNGMFQYSVKMLRWWVFLTAYTYLLTDRYPPFSPPAGEAGPAAAEPAPA